MGTFYGSVLVRTEKSDEVQKALDEVAKATDCKFLIGPAVNGWISAFPDNSGQNEKTSVEIAKRLPKDTPAPEFSVDAPIDDEADPNSRPLAYSVRFDAERNLLLSGCLAGVIQYLNVQNGQSGTLLKLLDEVSVWRLELTDDRNGLCCFCTSRPKPKNLNKREDFLQVWNYPALCKAAALD